MIKRLLVFASLMLLAISAIAQDEGVDLEVTELSATVVYLNDQTREIEVSFTIVQNEGYTDTAIVNIGTEWDSIDNEVVHLDDNRVPLGYIIPVPEDVFGQQIVVAEVSPGDVFDYDQSNNISRVSLEIPPLQVEPDASNPTEIPQTRGPNSTGTPWPPTNIPWLYIIIFAALAYGVYWWLKPGGNVGIPTNLLSLQIHASNSPPQNPQKGNYWVKKEVAVEPTRWQLNKISVQTQKPNELKCEANKNFVSVISRIIDTRKRDDQEEREFWNYEDFDTLVSQSYPIQAQFAWLDAEIKQVNIKLTFTIYKFNGTDWIDILSKSFSKRGTYHYVIPFASFPQTANSAYSELTDNIELLIHDLVDWPFKK